MPGGGRGGSGGGMTQGNHVNLQHQATFFYLPILNAFVLCTYPFWVSFPFLMPQTLWGFHNKD